MTKFLKLFLTMVMFTTFINCSMPSINEGNEEMVLVMKPIFGNGGVDMKPITSGRPWLALTTDYYLYPIINIKYEEVFDDIMSDENTPLDINVYAILKAQEGKTPILHKNYGINWYDVNVKEAFRGFIRDEVSSHGAYDLTSNRIVLDSIKIYAKTKLIQHFENLDKVKPFPVTVMDIYVDRAVPNDGLKDEIDKTAVQTQAQRTQNAQKDMEDARYNTEVARAKADKAYRDEMKLTADEFIKLRSLEIQKDLLDIIKNKPNVNIDVLLGTNSLNTWDIKQK